MRSTTVSVGRGFRAVEGIFEVWVAFVGGEVARAAGWSWGCGAAALMVAMARGRVFCVRVCVEDGHFEGDGLVLEGGVVGKVGGG